MDPENDDLHPIGVLIDELKNEDIALRKNSIKRMSTIALALGEERTRTELIPFIHDNTDDEDEVLLAMAEELGEFISYVGGPEYARTLLPPLETIASVEETVVREQAGTSLCKIGEALPEAHVVQYFWPLIKRLATGEWFTSRVSACSLFETGYRKGPPAVRAELRGLFNRLCHDETPMVRRAAAQNLGKFAAAVEKEFLKTELMTLFVDLTNDEQDSVRLLAVEGCSGFAKLLKDDQDVTTHILPIVTKYAEDKSWRVRYQVATQLFTLAEVVQWNVASTDLIPAYVKLLDDTEAEVRIAAAQEVEKMSNFCGKHNAAEDVMTKIIPAVKKLAGDQSQHVRAALAKVLMGLAPVLGKDNTVKELFPLSLRMLNDEQTDVKLAIISSLVSANVIDVVGIDALKGALVPAILDLAMDLKSWRIRKAIIEYIPQLAKSLGRDFITDQLTDLCVGFLNDSVYEIREYAGVNLQRLAELKEFGIEWATVEIVDKLVKMYNETQTTYLIRVNLVLCMAKLAPYVEQQVLMNSLVPTVQAALKDSVPNIKLCVAKQCHCFTARMLQLGLRNEVDSKILPLLKQLRDDKDVDVRHFGGIALRQLEATMS
mmetsp:Transcript_36279/g.43822  ORF Transcript_36279/g.43822 Transcript_36279/m.43822 type:complete len:602 (+) Transcript_36279:101-1906(+)|eukprot:CAMPEP_0197850090 /NCGR_PEP_ID=MMETSP1438-20131217/14203_1 /TAXON_ID=1461541 /ORGANISM="Pterosperma sp., Strain CCMP1384" /LENGTH=601 /DNA_ID=CAMNT_0043463061 /DNA_START=94 /DNA_END=1899 /DNA_ORIENTATION=-